MNLSTQGCEVLSNELVKIITLVINEDRRNQTKTLDRSVRIPAASGSELNKMLELMKNWSDEFPEQFKDFLSSTAFW